MNKDTRRPPAAREEHGDKQICPERDGHAEDHDPDVRDMKRMRKGGDICQ